MKKTNYINKYDFINYFSKQPSLWFFSNVEIISGIKLETKLSELGVDEDEFEEEDKIDEIDSYEIYKQLLIENEDIDKENPHIIEGLILDEKSREYIKNTFSHIKKVVDLTLLDNVDSKNLVQLAELTKKLLLENENIIIFQSVFIKDNLITRPDAIVKDNITITLIETKGTTVAKLYHALDIYFQGYILKNLPFLDDFDLDYQLCLVAYEKAKKNEVSFNLTSYFNYSKSPTLDKNDKWSRLGMRKYVENTEQTFISFKSICNQSLEDFEQKISESKGVTKKSLEKTMNNFLYVIENTQNIIDELTNHLKKIKNEKNIMCKNINPNRRDKNDFKVNELFNALKVLYVHKGYDIFKYSGNLIEFSSRNIESFMEKDVDIEKYYFRYGSKIVPIILNNKKSIIINDVSWVKQILSNLKQKKVYFDFETINSSIRAIDNTLPFMQIVTQCSIIIHDNCKIPVNELNCNNILIDPKNIKIDDYKNIVDSLYKGKDYSYVVYNKNFEKSRLEEFKSIINDDEYNKKIDIIINNLFDIADFFRYFKEKQSIPIIIKELYGYYSIKKVLPYVEQNYPDIYYKSGCKNYYDLEISNGLVCQNATTFHFLSNNPDYVKWNKLVEDMKIYCENDVRAMIAVELFIKKIITIF